MKPEEIKNGMEIYMKQIEENSKNELEKDFKKQVLKTKKESDQERTENEILSSILKESLMTAQKVYLKIK